jgi:hypothetical protein
VHGYTDDEDSHPDEAGYGFVALLQARTAAAVAEALDDFDRELHLLGKDKGRAIVRFHTDVDRSFLGKVKKLAVRKGWAQTDTGGYRSQGNSVVERRIGMLKQQARVVLLAATGGRFYYDQLWGHALQFANKCVNVTDWTGRIAPYTQLTGAPYKWGPNDHAFGELVLWEVNAENRAGPYQQPGEYGLWMGTDPTNGGAIVVPISWDSATDSWQLHRTVTAVTYRVYRGVYPLRMSPPKGGDPGALDKWVTRVMDPLLLAQAGGDALAGVVPDAGVSAPASCSGPPPSAVAPSGAPPSGAVHPVVVLEGEYEVERILNKRTVKGKTLYLVKWKGYDRSENTWESRSVVEDCAALDDFEQSFVERQGNCAFLLHAEYDTDEQLLYRAVCYAFEAHLQSDSLPGGVAGPCGAVAAESALAVASLLKRQRVGGTVEEWLPAYEAEFESVASRRLVELTPGEAARVRVSYLLPKLRMLLARKRCGRLKARLILQGFQEPFEWDHGVSNASPVAYLATVRALLARAGSGRVISSRDVSVAFLQSSAYGPGEDARYVSYVPYKGADPRVFRLLGPLYGQRSAPRRWYATVAAWLTRPESEGGAGLVQGCNEPCVFRHPTRDLVVVLYVDDILTSGDEASTAVFHERLGKEYECTEPSYLAPDSPLDFLGFSITTEVVDGETFIYMDQAEALSLLLSRFDAGELHPKDAPMPTRTLLNSDPTPLSVNAGALYKHLVGSLNYFVRTTRFDMAYAVSRLSSFMSSPTVGAWKALQHLLGYLKATVDFRIGGLIPASGDEFSYFVDSDHASDKANSTRSQTGYILFLNSFPVEWSSKRQPHTSVAPAEAEVYAMSEAVYAGRLLGWVAEEIGLEVRWPFELQSDSSQAVSYQHSTCPNSKMRSFFDLRLGRIQELRDTNIVTSKKILRDLNVADLLTHCLSGSQHWGHLDRAQNLRSVSCRGACVLRHVYSVTAHELI